MGRVAGVKNTMHYNLSDVARISGVGYYQLTYYCKKNKISLVGAPLEKTLDVISKIKTGISFKELVELTQKNKK